MKNQLNRFSAFSLIFSLVFALPALALAEEIPLVASIVSPNDNASFEINQNVDFSLSVSGGTAPYTFVWNFGDGTPGAAGQSVSHAYASAGAKTISLVVTDINNLTIQDQVVININQPIIVLPIDASITSPANNGTFAINQNIDFSLSVSGGTAPYTFVWNFGDGTPGAAGQTVSHSYVSAGAKTVTLRVTDINNLEKNLTLNLSINSGGGGGGDTKPVISNIRVTDVTETSAIVRWDTDRTANSRVIYDTTSHPSISDASFPNFGYANSSSLQDDSTKVTNHVVTISGLTANTTYFFRVLSQ